ncbi:unnamed protein product [Dovyalis caffra]|uniref:Uncharacterized protein n=1 Tax=Dovyalis caffra TaxID=77055 RepID=A0AAV1SM25_9ROSI|nr:unnamed protein product [Dovyalis caffra]
MVEIVVYGAIKAQKLDLEETYERIHKIRITLSSNNVKNRKKVYIDLVHGAKDKRPRVKGLVTIATKHVIDLFGSLMLSNKLPLLQFNPSVEVKVTIVD